MGGDSGLWWRRLETDLALLSSIKLRTAPRLLLADLALLTV